MARKRLGEILLERGWITRVDLTRALRTQQLVGGRLGTSLVENEVLSEELLAEALREQFGVPPATVEQLRSVSAETVALLPRKLAVRCRAVPLTARAGRLELAMDDPSNLSCQDEIAFATSRRLAVLVASEVRLLEALARYYDEAPPGRFVGLLDRLDRQSSLLRPGAGGVAEVDRLFSEAPPVPPSAPAPRPAAVPAAVPTVAETGAPVTAGRRQARTRLAAVTLSEEERAALYGSPGNPAATAVPPAQAPRREALTHADAERRLDEATDRDEVGRILLVVLRQAFPRAILFRVGRDGVQGWMASGEGLDPGRLAALEIPFDRPSIFLNLRQGSVFHLGPLPAMPAHRALVGLLGGEPAPDCLLLPVRLGERMVVVAYGDRAGDRLAGLDLEALRALAVRAAAALERCISLKRKAHFGPSGG